jgi:hypothetical protein
MAILINQLCGCATSSILNLISSFLSTFPIPRAKFFKGFG